MQEVFEKIIEELEKYEYENLVEHDSEQIQHCKQFDDCGFRDCTLCIFDKAIEIVKQEAEKYNNGWIPCSERLPEENQKVILQDIYGNITIETMKISNGLEGFRDGDWWSSANNYLAWRPLPEPYKEND